MALFGTRIPVKGKSMPASTPLPNISVGDSFGPMTRVITPDIHEQYLFAWQNYSARYTQPNPENGRLEAHPGVVIDLAQNRVTSEAFAVPHVEGWTGMHARDEVELHGPLYVGDTMIITWKVTDISERKRRIWWTRTLEVRDDESNELRMVRKVHTAFFRNSSDNGTSE